MARATQPFRPGFAYLRVIAAGTVIAIGVGGILIAMGPGKDAKKEAAKAGGNTDQATVQKMSFDISTTSTGELKAKKQTEIRSELETESTIVEIVAEGTVVKKGDQLIKLQSDPIQTHPHDEPQKPETATADLVAA
jgi:multidrug efflux pump subunit AcrA (membrane-fusion protein)